MKEVTLPITLNKAVEEIQKAGADADYSTFRKTKLFQDYKDKPLKYLDLFLVYNKKDFFVVVEVEFTISNIGAEKVIYMPLITAGNKTKNILFQIALKYDLVPEGMKR